MKFMDFTFSSSGFSFSRIIAQIEPGTADARLERRTFAKWRNLSSLTNMKQQLEGLGAVSGLRRRLYSDRNSTLIIFDL